MRSLGREQCSFRLTEHGDSASEKSLNLNFHNAELRFLSILLILIKKSQKMSTSFFPIQFLEIPTSSALVQAF